MEMISVKTFRVAACVLLCCLVLGFVSTALVAPALQWHTDRLYYDNLNRIVIEGYFYNSGTRTITWVNWYDAKVYFRQHNTGWWLQAEGMYHDLPIYLEPGDSIRWKFRITDAGYSYFDYYDVQWNVNYQYR